MPETMPDYHAAAIAMIAQGGSFVSALGQLYLRADPTNQFKVRSAFPDEFASYVELANSLRASRLRAATGDA